MTGGGMARKLLAAAVLGLLLLAALAPAGATKAGYWDTTLQVVKGKGREPLLLEYNGSLWNIYQYRTELRDVGINLSGRRSDIYYTVLNSSVGNGPARTGNVSDWSPPVSLVPKSRDENGHGVHGPYASVYKGKLYVTMEAVEPSIKDDDAQVDYDILLRVFDGKTWDPPLDAPARVISERNDINVSDTECRSITLGDKLYFIWDQVPVDVGAGNQPLVHFRQIVYRSFDGTSWGPITVAASGNRSILGVPHLAVFRDSIWVSFQTNSSEQDDVDIEVIRFDGTSWSAPQRINPAVEGSPVRRQNMNSRLAVYGDRLYCVWQSADAIAKSGRDYDVLVASTDGVSGWSAPFEVNPAGDSDPASLTGQDITPDIKAHNGTLYVTWASNSTRINDGGEDFDIMLRPFNGSGWGPVSQVSPAGDNGTIGGDHNVGDDNTPWLCSWNGSLYCTWISYDQGGIGHKGGNPSVIARRVLGPAAVVPPDDVPPVGGGGTGPAAPFPWAAALVLLAAVIVVAGLVLVFRPFRGGPARDEPETLKNEEAPGGKG